MHKTSKRVWAFREDGYYWSTTRQFMFIVIAVFVLALPVVVPLFCYFSQESERQYNQAVAIFNSLDFEKRKILYESFCDSKKITFESCEEVTFMEKHTAIHSLRGVILEVVRIYIISSALYFFVYACIVQGDNRGLFSTDKWGRWDLTNEDDSDEVDGCFFYADIPMQYQVAKIVMVLAMGPVALPFLIVSRLRLRWCISVKRTLVDLRKVEADDL